MSYTIFLVDDHPLVREWLTALLAQQPDFVVCGDSDSAALALPLIERLRPDAVIVDISLPTGSGIALVKEIGRVSPKSVCLMLSMHDELTFAERALRAGARGYVSKRNTTRTIISALRHVLAGNLYVSDEFKDLVTTRVFGGVAAVDDSQNLSDREFEVLQLLGQGLETKNIAQRLQISIKTVQAYCSRIKEKLGLRSHAELLREAVRRHDDQVGR